jgi:hypothetical protein
LTRLTVIVSIGLVLGAISAPAQASLQLFLNNQAITLKNQVFGERDQTFVPLIELAQLLGVEATATYESIVLRWGLGQLVTLTPQDLVARGPVWYISLFRLTQILDVRALKLRNAYYLFSTPARLLSVTPSSGGVFFTFSARVPFELHKKDQLVTVRFFHAAGEISDSARHALPLLTKEAPEILKAHFPIDRSLSAQAISVEAEKKFIVWVRFEASHTSSSVLVRTESQTRLNEHATYVQAQALTLAGPVKLHYLVVKNWQQTYRLSVTLPRDGIGSLEPLDQMAIGAFAAINANFFDPSTHLPIGLLMKDGVLHSSPYGRRGALTVTLFGNLEFAAPSLKIYASVLGHTVVIDGLNRPPYADGLFLYTDRYALPIRSETPLKAVRLRYGFVVSVTENGLVLPDGESTLLVATGTGRSRLGGLRPGDRVTISQALEPAPLFLREAVSAGPLLLKDGQIVLDTKSESFSEEFARARAARSIIALTESGDVLFIAILKDGRSVGADLRTAATLVKALGAYHALAMDGGSSSTLIFRQGATFQSVGGRRPIAAGLALMPKR